MTDMRGYVYILKSLVNERYYIGSTTNINSRFDKHQRGLVKSTKNLRPLKIELVQEYESITIAKQIEYRIKQLKRRDYLEKMIKSGHIKMSV